MINPFWIPPKFNFPDYKKWLGQSWPQRWSILAQRRSRPVSARPELSNYRGIAATASCYTADMFGAALPQPPTKREVISDNP